MINKDLYFVLSSTCKLVKGLKRCVIIDYDRGNLYFISHEYLALLDKLDRNRVRDIDADIDSDSKAYFEEFLDFLVKTELGLLTADPSVYPLLSDEFIDDYMSLIDCIIELDKAYFDEDLFVRLCRDLHALKCKDFELRLLSPFDPEFLHRIIDIVSATSANSIEIHCTYDEEINDAILHEVIEKNILVSKLYVYSSPECRIMTIVNETTQVPVPLGEVIFLDYPFDDGNCCGIIQQANLNYTSFHVHNLLKQRNGCLDRKLAVDRYGNIKNCPSIKAVYGNLRDISVKEVINMDEFRKYWFIHKDQISVCKTCEFRYNCTDCRAFLQDPNDLYSKPLKCGYDPATCTWEDWSTNPLKAMESRNKEVMIQNP
jgi:SPASM domain peptide maturase of grasp-with-spasm system